MGATTGMPVVPAQRVSPCSTARAAAWVRFDAPSFEMQALTWCPTVPGLITSRSAISALLNPLTTSASTSCSRLVKSYPNFGGRIWA